MALVIWKENALVSIKLRDDLYTIGQMLISPTMRFFDIASNAAHALAAHFWFSDKAGS